MGDRRGADGGPAGAGSGGHLEHTRPTAAATYLVHHLELITEALHLLFQVLELILLNPQQHLGTHAQG